MNCLRITGRFWRKLVLVRGKNCRGLSKGTPCCLSGNCMADGSSSREFDPSLEFTQNQPGLICSLTRSHEWRQLESGCRRQQSMTPCGYVNPSAIPPCALGANSSTARLATPPSSTWSQSNTCFSRSSLDGGAETHRVAWVVLKHTDSSLDGGAETHRPHPFQMITRPVALHSEVVQMLGGADHAAVWSVLTAMLLDLKRWGT